MTESLTITYTELDTDTDTIFCVVEALPFKDEVADMSDAAALLDAAFYTDPCTGNVVDRTKTKEEQLFLTEEEFLAEAAQIAPSNACLYAENYIAQIEVYRSELSIDYTFRIDIGTVLTSETQRDLVTRKKYDLECDNSLSVKLKYPIYLDIHRGYDIRMYNEAGDEVYYPVSNNSVQFGATTPYSGNLTVYHYSKYDLIKVDVPFDPTDEDPTRPRALVFYDKLVYDDEVVPPSIDQDNLGDCSGYDENYSYSSDVIGGGSGNCTKRVRHYTRCQCGYNNIADDWMESPIFPCDDWDDYPIEVFEGFVWCEGDIEDVNSPAFFLETCCEPKPQDKGLPLCKRTTSVYYGGEEPEEKDFYVGKYGVENVVFIPVSPEDGPCGEHIVEFDVDPKNCCDEIPDDLTYDEDNSISVIADDSSGDIYWYNGAAPFKVAVTGTNVFLDADHTRTIYEDVSNRTMTLYTGDSCGFITVTITDACDRSIEEEIKASEGSWKLLGSHRTTNPSYIWPDVFWIRPTNSYTWYTSELVNVQIGKYAAGDYPQPNFNSTDVWGIGSGTTVSCTDPEPGEFVKNDSYTGLFRVWEVYDLVHNLGSTCVFGSLPLYRNFRYFVPGSDIFFYEWSC